MRHGELSSHLDTIRIDIVRRPVDKCTEFAWMRGEDRSTGDPLQNFTTANQRAKRVCIDDNRPVKALKDLEHHCLGSRAA